MNEGYLDERLVWKMNVEEGYKWKVNMKMVKVSSDSKGWLVFILLWFNECGYSYEKISMKATNMDRVCKEWGEHYFQDVLFYYYSRWNIFICWKYDKQESIVKCLITFITFHLSLWGFDSGLWWFWNCFIEATGYNVCTSSCTLRERTATLLAELNSWTVSKCVNYDK